MAGAHCHCVALPLINAERGESFRCTFHPGDSHASDFGHRLGMTGYWAQSTGVSGLQTSERSPFYIRKSTSFSAGAYCVGITYLPGKLPCKYCRRG